MSTFELRTTVAFLSRVYMNATVAYRISQHIASMRQRLPAICVPPVSGVNHTAAVDSLSPSVRYASAYRHRARLLIPSRNYALPSHHNAIRLSSALPPAFTRTRCTPLVAVAYSPLLRRRSKARPPRSVRPEATFWKVCRVCGQLGDAMQGLVAVRREQISAQNILPAHEREAASLWTRGTLDSVFTFVSPLPNSGHFACKEQNAGADCREVSAAAHAKQVCPLNSSRRCASCCCCCGW